MTSVFNTHAAAVLQQVIVSFTVRKKSENNVCGNRQYMACIKQSRLGQITNSSCLTVTYYKKTAETYRLHSAMDLLACQAKFSALSLPLIVY